MPPVDLHDFLGMSSEILLLPYTQIEFNVKHSRYKTYRFEYSKIYNFMANGIEIECTTGRNRGSLYF